MLDIPEKIENHRNHRPTSRIIDSKIQKQNNTTNYTLLQGSSIDTLTPLAPEALQNLPLFANLLDGATEDIDRPLGYTSKYKHISTHNIDAITYRSNLYSESDPYQPNHILFKTLP